VKIIKEKWKWASKYIDSHWREWDDIQNKNWTIYVNKNWKWYIESLVNNKNIKI
jgi:hypothetical protein